MELKTEIQKYEDMLKFHDWYFEWSDDHRVWSKGNINWKILQEKQKKLDLTFEIWNKYAPKDFQANTAS